MELIPFNGKNEPPSVKSPRERAFDAAIEAKTCETNLRKTVAYYSIVKDAVIMLFVLTIFTLAAAGYIPYIFILPTAVYAVIKVRGENFDRVVEHIFHRRE